MKVFGLTGGVGMGKSTAAEIFCARKIPVLDTDILARQIVEPGQPALVEIGSAFGSEVISSEGALLRNKLAAIVFADPEKRRLLEEITHPRIRALWQSQVNAWRTAGEHSLAIVVIPLLFETFAEKEFDGTICVACSASTQRQRLSQRDWTAVQIQQRIAAQWAAEKKMAAARYVVWSEGELGVLAEQLDRILEKTL